MRNFFKTYWKPLLFFAIVGLVGGFFVGLYQLDSFPDQLKQQVYDQGITRIQLGVIAAIQSAGWGIVLGALGIWLAKKIGLWKEERTLAAKPLMITLAVGVVGGTALILSDWFFFGSYSQAILDIYAVKPSIPYVIATLTYGAVIEEVMLRLFLMSLIAFVLYKVFEKNQDRPSVIILIVANFVAAVLFAAGHLPFTHILLGSSPVIILRCFLLNGGLALAFGFLYRKYGFRYAMIAHGGCHMVSNLIWIWML